MNLDEMCESLDAIGLTWRLKSIRFPDSTKAAYVCEIQTRKGKLRRWVGGAGKNALDACKNALAEYQLVKS